tara:strand:+ start:273 stop:470 length:198 start_codon:yes stop_codon:yes gene_type:complete
MKEIIDMAQAHLTNVKKEIERLSQQREQLSTEIKRLSDYLEQGGELLDSHRAELQENASSVEDTP